MKNWIWNTSFLLPTPNGVAKLAFEIVILKSILEIVCTFEMLMYANSGFITINIPKHVVSTCYFCLCCQIIHVFISHPQLVFMPRFPKWFSKHLNLIRSQKSIFEVIIWPNSYSTTGQIQNIILKAFIFTISTCSLTTA